MSISMRAISEKYNADTWKIEPYEYLKNQWNKEWDKDLIPVGILKSIEHECKLVYGQCPSCQEDNDDEHNYCHDCGEALKHDQTYSQYTEYSQRTALDEKEAIGHFLRNLGNVNKEDIECKKMIKFSVYYNQECYDKALKAQIEQNRGWLDEKSP